VEFDERRGSDEGQCTRLAATGEGERECVWMREGMRDGSVRAVRARLGVAMQSVVGPHGSNGTVASS
jgi:hypothetical protein